MAGTLGLALALCAPQTAWAQTARENGVAYARAIAAAERTLQAWLRDADPKTGLMPDRLTGEQPRQHAAQLRGRPVPVPDSHRPAHRPGPLRGTDAGDAAERGALHDRGRRRAGQPRPAHRHARAASLFGAGEYAKDGLITVTELLGRTPWFHRMADLIADAMDARAHESRWGKLPAVDSELNGDFLQVLVRLSHDDRRRALPRVGAPHRGRLRGRGAARQLRRAVDEVGLRQRIRASRSCACAITATS